MDENITYHNIVLENRKNLTINGVKDCLEFEEETLKLLTTQGKMTIKGTGLHIEHFNTDDGDLKVSGKIAAIVYTADESNNGFFSKIFK